MSNEKIAVTNSLCSREKFWSELDDKGRLERLRVVAKRNQSNIETLMARVRKLEDQLERHGHSPISGLSVLPIHNPNCWQNESIGRVRSDSDGDDCYI